MGVILYNVTVKVELEINNDWLEWMKTKHIPDVLATGMFFENRIYRVMEEDSSDGFTYAVQYSANNMTDYLRYQEEFAPALQKEHSDRYKDKFVAFRTTLREV